ncbi:MAG TPA: protein kinase [Kofleriaceae bacterium]|nr:protein kinase [Kofleriaceae bacterium]
MSGGLIDGRYRIIEELGRGGMGCVYRAEHIGLRREVALKVLRARAGQGTTVDRQRFEREAFATGRLRHPNCVATTDFGVLADGSSYLVMELLVGQRLSDALEVCGRMPAARALHIMRHVLSGVAHAHELGVIHRDLKPQNVVLIDHLGDADFAKVLDFGLAKLQGDALLAEGGAKLTATGITFGSPHYMSPEQAFGNPVDHRSDLYAAAVMLFELIAGAPPFDASEIRSILMMHATRGIPRMHEIARDVSCPVEVELLIRQGLAKDPRDRMASARELIAGIDRCLDLLDSDRTHLRLPTPFPAAARRTSPPPAEPTVPLEVVVPPTGAGSIMEAVVRPAEPSMTVAPPRPRSLGWALGLGAAAAVALLVAVIVWPGDPSAPGTATAALPVPAALMPAASERPPTELAPTIIAAAVPASAPDRTPDPDLDAALALVRAGRDREAQQALESLRSKRPGDAAVAYHLANLYYDRPWPPQALRAYRDAMRLDPGYRSDPTLLANTIRALSSHSARGLAFQLLEREIGAPALPLLEETAASHGNKQVRARAARLAAKLAALRGVPD